MIEKKIDEYLKEITGYRRSTGSAQRKKHCLDQINDSIDSVERTRDWLTGFYDTDFKDKFKAEEDISELQEVIQKLRNIYISVQRNIK